MNIEVAPPSGAAFATSKVPEIRRPFAARCKGAHIRAREAGAAPVGQPLLLTLLK